jgi:hypothetical protein
MEEGMVDCEANSEIILRFLRKSNKVAEGLIYEGNGRQRRVLKVAKPGDRLESPSITL